MPRGVRVCVCGEGGGVVRGGVNLFWLLDARLSKTAENPAFFFFPPLLHVSTPNCCWMKNGTKIPPAAARRTAQAAPAPLRTAPAPLPAPPRPPPDSTSGGLSRRDSRFGGAPPVVPRSRGKQHMHPCVDRGDEALPIRD